MIHSSSHAFNIEIAKKYDVNIAIFLANMAFWINQNRANNKHFHNGRHWTYNSTAAYTKLFEYWTAAQIRTIINNAKKFGLIMTGNFNSNAYDRTQWYAFTDEGHKLAGIPICENQQMDVKEQTLPFVKNDKCIYTDINTDINTDLEKPIEKSKTKPEKPIHQWREENSARHPFATNMDANANEAAHIEEHEKRKRDELALPRSGMPTACKEQINRALGRSVIS